MLAHFLICDIDFLIWQLRYQWSANTGTANMNKNLNLTSSFGPRRNVIKNVCLVITGN